MKYLLLLFTCFAINVTAQTRLDFNKPLTQSVNKWVALKTAQDSVYGFGFIYMDPTAGLTAQDEGSFRITRDNKFVATKRPIYQIIKVRLDGKQLNVAWIPTEKFKELDVLETPDWLKSYKADTTSASYLFRWGFTYNAGNEIDKALYYLNRVQKIDPSYPGLEFGYIYAYNSGKQYSKAIAMIENALKSRPRDANLYKELLFAQVNSGQFNKAEETYKIAMPNLSADIKAEMALNLASNYLMQKNKEKFKFWADDIQTWLPTTSARYGSFLKMKEYYATLK
ncbi:tetratricopeptide repeat protein [Mucilaginibacter sp. UYCu711]|uniref:tetratricopeptide repeat protein n=1 Tax=Mucilaginibacter sp. UYCu711 TaxID=3156339 RepID=UPI003D1D53F2